MWLEIWAALKVAGIALQVLLAAVIIVPILMLLALQAWERRGKGKP